MASYPKSEQLANKLGCKLVVSLGKPNKIRYVENVATISEIGDRLEVDLLDESQIAWLENQLLVWNKAWVDGQSYADRRAINERYGWR